MSQQFIYAKVVYRRVLQDKVKKDETVDALCKKYFPNPEKRHDARGKKMQIFMEKLTQAKRILIPLHMGKIWKGQDHFILFVIDNNDGVITVTCFDSFWRKEFEERYQEIQSALAQWYEKIMTVKDPKWQQKDICLPIATRKSCHQQTLSDCAIFALSNAVILMREGTLGANKNPRGEIDDAWWDPKRLRFLRYFFFVALQRDKLNHSVEGITLEDASPCPHVAAR